MQGLKERIPISWDVFISCKREGETFKTMLQRMDGEYSKKSTRVQLAKDLHVNIRKLYRLLETYQISEYKPANL